ncbi:MAG: DUF6152 family protein [Acidobacteriota bacterium]
MKWGLCTVAIIAAMAAGRVSAHHSYAAYETDRILEVEGVIEDFEVVAPHSLLRVKSDDGRLYTAEWQSPIGLKRIGVQADTLRKGDRVVLKGNPRRDFAGSGVVNFKGVTRASDGWTWPRQTVQAPVPLR